MVGVTLLLAMTETAADAPTFWECLTLVGGWLITPAVLGFIWAGYRAFKRGQLLNFIYGKIERGKIRAADAGEPGILKALTNDIREGLDRIPGLGPEHRRAIKRAGVNLDAILGPAIVSGARLDDDPNAGDEPS